MPAPAFAADAATERSYLEARQAASRDQRPHVQSQLTQALQQAVVAPTDTSDQPAICQQAPSHAPPMPCTSAPGGSLGPEAPLGALQRLRPGTQRVPPRVASVPATTLAAGLVGTWSSTTLSTSFDAIGGTTPPLVTGSLTLDFTGKFTALPPLPGCLRGSLLGSSAGAPSAAAAAAGGSSSGEGGGLLPLRKCQSALELTGGLPHTGLQLPAPEGRAPEGGQCSAAERAAKLARYREKRARRNYQPSIMYASRKALADSRPRVGGRFARSSSSSSDGGGGAIGCGLAAALQKGNTAAGGTHEGTTQVQEQPAAAQVQQPAFCASGSACHAAAAEAVGSMGAVGGSATEEVCVPDPPAIAAAPRSAASGSMQWEGLSDATDCAPGLASSSGTGMPPAAAAVRSAADATATLLQAAAAEGGGCSGTALAGDGVHQPAVEYMDMDHTVPVAIKTEPDGLSPSKAPAAAGHEAAASPHATAAGGGEGQRGGAQAWGHADTADKATWAIGVAGEAWQVAPGAPVVPPCSSLMGEDATCAAPWLLPATTGVAEEQLQQQQEAQVPQPPEEHQQQEAQEQMPKLRRCGLSGTFSQLRMQGWEAAAGSPCTPAAGSGCPSGDYHKEEGWATPYSRSLPADWLGHSGNPGAPAAAGGGSTGGCSGGLEGCYSTGRLLGSGMKRGSFCLGLGSSYGEQPGQDPHPAAGAATSSSSRGEWPHSSASPTSAEESAAAARAPDPCAWAEGLFNEPHMSEAPPLLWDHSQLPITATGLEWQDAPRLFVLEGAQPASPTPGMLSQAGGGGHVQEHLAAPALPAVCGWGAVASPFADCATGQGFWDAGGAAAGAEGAGCGALVPAGTSCKGGLQGTFASFSTLHSVEPSAADVGCAPDVDAITSSGTMPSVCMGAAAPPATAAPAALEGCDYIQEGCLLAAAAAAAGDVDELEQALMAFPLAAFGRVLPVGQS